MSIVRLLLIAGGLAQIGAQPVLVEVMPKKLNSPGTLVQFAWSSAASADSFLVQFDTVPTFAAPLYSVYRKTANYPFRPGEVIPPKRVYWRVSGSQDFTLFSAPGEFTISAAPSLDDYPRKSTGNLRAYVSWQSHKWASAVKIQVDEDSTFASPLISEEGVPMQEAPRGFRSIYHPKRDYPLGRIYWRISSSYDYSEYSPAVSVVIDTNVKDLPTTRGAVYVSNTNNVMQFNLNYRDSRVQVDTTLAFASPPRIFGNDSYHNAAFSDALRPGKKYWRANSNLYSHVFSRPDSFVISSAPFPTAPQTKSPGLRPYFRWKQVVGAAKYKVEIASEPDFSTPLLSQSGVESLVYQATKDLKVDQTYFWRASSDYDSTTFSPTSSFTIDTSYLPILHPVSPNRTTLGTPTLAWASSLPTIHYQVQVDTQISFAAPFINQTVSFPYGSHFIPITKQLPLGRYFWRVSSGIEFSIFAKPDSFRVVDNLDVGLRQKKHLPSFFPRNRALTMGDLPEYTASLEMKIFNQLGKKVWSGGIGIADLQAYGIQVPRLSIGRYTARVEFFSAQRKLLEIRTLALETSPP